MPYISGRKVQIKSITSSRITDGAIEDFTISDGAIRRKILKVSGVYFKYRILVCFSFIHEQFY